MARSSVHPFDHQRRTIQFAQTLLSNELNNNTGLIVVATDSTFEQRMLFFTFHSDEKTFQSWRVAMVIKSFCSDVISSTLS